MTTADRLNELRRLLTDARPVPMSASCMVNRAEAIAMVDQALSELPAELDKAKEVIEAREQERLRGKEEGDRIRLEAEEWAATMAKQTEINKRAEARAEKLLADARAEAEGLKAETDAFVDQRMAEFEAALQKTHSQVRIMRARLADRSDLDSSDTQPLPRI